MYVAFIVTGEMLENPRATTMVLCLMAASAFPRPGWDMKEIIAIDREVRIARQSCLSNIPGRIESNSLVVVGETQEYRMFPLYTREYALGTCLATA